MEACSTLGKTKGFSFSDTMLRFLVVDHFVKSSLKNIQLAKDGSQPVMNINRKTPGFDIAVYKLNRDRRPLYWGILTTN